MQMSRFGTNANHATYTPCRHGMHITNQQRMYICIDTMYVCQKKNYGPSQVESSALTVQNMAENSSGAMSSLAGMVAKMTMG